MKFSFKIQNRWGETLSVSDCHSFEEAITHVERGVYERDLAIGRRLHASGIDVPPDIRAKLVAVGEIKDEPAAPAPAPAVAPTPAPTAPAKPVDPEAPTMTQPIDVEVVQPAAGSGEESK